MARLLLTAEEIRNALTEARPTHIAVAYVGAGWRAYVDPDGLEEIVVSPTLGSNPEAIEALMNELGDENVHFLDELHSKIYIGAAKAVVGSCNLSDPGLSDFGHFEAAVLLEGESSLKRLGIAFDNYRNRAREEYGDRESKMERLRELRLKRDRAVCHGIVAEGDRPPPLLVDYSSELDRIHLTWVPHNGVQAEFDRERLAAEIPALRSESVGEYFSYWMIFLEQDDVRQYDWILYWIARADGLPHANRAIRWMRVHHVVSHAAPGERPYTKLAGEARQLQAGRPPFRLGNRTQELIRQVLASGDFPTLLRDDDNPWSLEQADPVVPRFLAAVRDAQRQELEQGATADDY